MSQQRETPSGVPDWTLGWRLKRALQWGNIPAVEMADHLGYSRAQISRYLNDKGEPPRLHVLRQWAELTGVPVEWLLHGESASGLHKSSSTWIAVLQGHSTPSIWALAPTG